LEGKISDFLRGCEEFIREKIIKEVSWFRQRDAQASAAISTVYNFYKHYRFSDAAVEAVSARSLREEIKELADECNESFTDVNYEKDELLGIFLNCAKPNKANEVERIIQTIDYVSGMTDRRLMDVHDIAFRLFR
jgi:dGTP triphosphohydrolase